MKRLREKCDSSDANEAYGAALLARIGPLQPSTARKNRLRFALRRSLAMTARRRRRRPALVLGLLMSATGASAMVARFMHPAIAPSPAAIEMPTSTASRAPAAPARVKAAARADEFVSSLPPKIPDTPIADRSSSAVAGVAHARRAPGGPKATRIHAIAPMRGLAQPPPTSGVGAAMVIEAMRARRAGDLDRAADLLWEYQSTYPDGALQEEALALSIEVAARSGKSTASALAARYLARYPKGRFRDEARRALKTTPR